MKYHYLMCTKLEYVYIGNKEKSFPLLTGILVCFCLDKYERVEAIKSARNYFRK